MAIRVLLGATALSLSAAFASAQSIGLDEIGQSASAPRLLTYAHVWGGVPPEPYYSRAVSLVARGDPSVIVSYQSRRETETFCGSARTQAGWVRSACAQHFGSLCIIRIADDVPRGPALYNLLVHEVAHCPQIGWAAEHPGAEKPLDHLANCLATGLPLRRVESLCYLDGGAPLRTAQEQAQWAALR